MAEGAAFEMRSAGNRRGGSNPSLSDLRFTRDYMDLESLFWGQLLGSISTNILNPSIPLSRDKQSALAVLYRPLDHVDASLGLESDVNSKSQ